MHGTTYSVGLQFVLGSNGVRHSLDFANEVGVEYPPGFSEENGMSRRWVVMVFGGKEVGKNPDLDAKYDEAAGEATTRLGQRGR